MMSTSCDCQDKYDKANNDYANKETHALSRLSLMNWSLFKLVDCFLCILICYSQIIIDLVKFLSLSFCLDSYVVGN